MKRKDFDFWMKMFSNVWDNQRLVVEELGKNEMMINNLTNKVEDLTNQIAKLEKKTNKEKK